MYKAVIPFTCGANTYRSGDTVPDMPHNDKRLAKGLIKEVKVTQVKETKNVSKRKPKNTAKSSK